MGRNLGRVEFGDGEPDRFFIHCNTAGWSFSPLFADPADAWRVYDADERGEALHRAVPMSSAVIRVVRKSLAHGRSFGPDGAADGEPLFGLATTDRLLYPLSSGFEERPLCLLMVGGVLHVASDADIGFGGVYEHPLCEESWTWNAADQRLSFDQMFGQALDLCPRCAAALLPTCN
ncbi:hypothetical protein [Burkholderia lata]|uniref:hypothetical protein n=1 Tax=Burkholderia lata (strain ATCC 17760 / DSM 23089 / LMG 22485 / NCIMB 9086 / R18194 / 383) TaxID=482957 RepID=UPI00158276BB|nr:hypothetical protein [Burkholderia lata]